MPLLFREEIMTKSNVVRLLVIMVLLSGLAAVELHACGCTACVQTDDGLYGCWVDFGCSAWCETNDTGTTCSMGGYAGNGCKGPLMQ